MAIYFIMYYKKKIVNLKKKKARFRTLANSKSETINNAVRYRFIFQIAD